MRIATLLLILALLLGGCLGEPPVEERWTNLEFLEVPDFGATSFGVGDSVSVQVRSRVTFRDQFVGFVVGELRVSQTLSADSLFLDHTRDAIVASENVDRLLTQSSPVARGTKGLAGFPQLRRTLDMHFEATVPGFVDGRFDPPGGTPRGLFLVLYMGEGEEVEQEDGSDSLVVRPFLTHEDQILAKAIALPFGDGLPQP